MRKARREKGRGRRKGEEKEEKEEGKDEEVEEEQVLLFYPVMSTANEFPRFALVLLISEVSTIRLLPECFPH